MKKVFLSLMVVCAGLIFMSCSSLPKNATAGNNVVVGQLFTEGKNYHGKYSAFNGLHYKENRITIKSKVTGKELELICDEYGYFSTAKLVSDEAYYISKIQLTVEVSNAVSWVWVNLPQSFDFVANDMTITNLGNFYYCFDNEGKGFWTNQAFKRIEDEYIDRIVEGTNWERASVVRQGLGSDYVEWIRK